MEFTQRRACAPGGQILEEDFQVRVQALDRRHSAESRAAARHQFRGVQHQFDAARPARAGELRSEEHTSELQSRLHLVCRLLLEKKKAVHFIGWLFEIAGYDTEQGMNSETDENAHL